MTPPKRTSLNTLFRELNNTKAMASNCLPPSAAVQEFAEELFKFLFPVTCTSSMPAEVRHGILRSQLTGLLQTAMTASFNDAAAVADHFFGHMPDVYAHLQDDVRAALAFDPAAESAEEVVASYPGFFAIATYRLAHELFDLRVPLLPRLLTEYAHGRTGIDIHPGAAIGERFFIDHGTGIVIGATSVIGNDVKLYQGVTLGGLQVDKSLAGTKRHPTVESNVVIYANATILGGETVVGHDSVVGGNVFLTESVPPFSTVYHKSQVSMRQRKIPGVVDFVI